MQISTKFTIAVHILMAAKYFEGKQKITSSFLAGSIGSNPVIVRNIMLQLQEAGLINVKRGPGGITINRPLSQITYLDIYKAVETNSGNDLFRFHEIRTRGVRSGGTSSKLWTTRWIRFSVPWKRSWRPITWALYTTISKRQWKRPEP